MEFTGPIEVFFKPPSEPPSPDGDCLLFHLRRDLETLYGPEPQYATVSPSHALLATMGILAGVDYLSQVYSSADSSRKRFVETLQDVVTGNNHDAEALYQLRCALMHEIGLSTVSDSAYRKGTRFSFKLSDLSSKPLLTELSDSGTEVSYLIGFWALKGAFVKIISDLSGICRSTSDPRLARVINEIGQRHPEKILKT